MLTEHLLKDIPNLKGSYVLDLRVTSDFVWNSRAGKTLDFSSGRYLYCGSANGSGGMKARLTRHCRLDKKVHWHVDPLTIQFGVHALYFTSTETECDLVEFLLKNKGTIPFKGFGSSDCPKCPSHLVQLSDEKELNNLFKPEQVLGPIPYTLC